MHGTPRERVGAALMGFLAAMKVVHGLPQTCILQMPLQQLVLHHLTSHAHFTYHLDMMAAEQLLV